MNMKLLTEEVNYEMTPEQELTEVKKQYGERNHVKVWDREKYPDKILNINQFLVQGHKWYIITML